MSADHDHDHKHDHAGEKSGGHSHSHAHAKPDGSNEAALWKALGLTATFLIAEVVAGLVFNSLALLSDAAHMFTDAAALGIGLAAVRIARRVPDSRRTFGYHRFEILAAAFNAMLLFGVAIYILIEAVERFKTPEPVQTTGMLIVAVLGLIINLISMKLLIGGKDKSLNVKGAYLEVLSDMVGSVGVIVGAVAIRFTGWTWLDPLIAVAIGFWVVPRTWIVLKETVNILLEGVPVDIDAEAVRKSLLDVQGVQSIHDLHIWALTSGNNSLSVHVVYDPEADQQNVLKTLREILENEFGISHSTIQCEIAPCSQGADRLHA